MTHITANSHAIFLLVNECKKLSCLLVGAGITTHYVNAYSNVHNAVFCLSIAKNKKRSLRPPFFHAGGIGGGRYSPIICTALMVVVWCPARPPTTTPPRAVPAMLVPRIAFFLVQRFLILFIIRDNIL